MRRFSLLIFDLDNTIYDWYSAFLPAFYEMVSIAANALKIDRETLLDELREVHVKHHDVEHPFGLVETAVVREKLSSQTSEQVWALLDPAFHAFNSKRKLNLKPYPGTIETLTSLSNRGIRLVAYTDSTYFAAWGRVERLGLVDLLETVYCREKGTSVLPPRDVLRHRLPPDGKIVEIPSHKSKPNPRVLTDIIAAQGYPLSDVAYVGDSLAKDILMAKRAGCFAIWAKYGAHTDKQMYDSLVRISHWTAEDIHRERNYASEAQSLIPDFVCQRSLEELLTEVSGPASFAVSSR
jgi:FMN phosphatase YigB (HAD superfamily)